MKIKITAEKIQDTIDMLKMVQEWNDRNREKSNLILDSKQKHFERVKK